MAKKMNYQYGIKMYLTIEVETEEEIVFVEESNRETENEKGRERTYQSKLISSDWLFEQFEFEFPSEELSPLDRLIVEERNNYINCAIKKLTPKQQKIIKGVFWEDKSLREISREMKQHVSTIAEAYHSALAKLGALLKDLDKF